MHLSELKYSYKCTVYETRKPLLIQNLKTGHTYITRIIHKAVLTEGSVIQ